MSEAVPALRVQGARKAFGGVQALAGVDLTLFAGEIHALLGENGAGKSTLLKSLAGVHRLDAGQIEVGGETFHQGSTRRSQDQGIAVIYQEPSLFPDLSLAENVFIGRQPVVGGRVDWSGMTKAASELFSRLGVQLNPTRKARGLSIADQQIVEIAKALSMSANIIVMDEPTAALSSAEVDRLFGVARRLREGGAAVVFVSHRLDEVFALCDRITIMRDGATVHTCAIMEIDTAQVVRWMVGRDLTEMFPKVPSQVGDVVLRVQGLCSTGQFEDITFDVRAGEIVGLAGLVGSGRSEVVRAIFGVDSYDSGTVQVLGKELPAHDPNSAMTRGIALVPEDRRLEGLFMPSSIARNIAMTRLRQLSRKGFLHNRTERTLAADWAARMQVKFSDLEAPVQQLSGGNQQKVVLGKWLATAPRLLIVDEPTRGIDVGTKAEVHRLLSIEASKGMAVLMISSELPEVLGMADRIIVMREGRITGEFSREEATQERIMHAATQSGVAA